MASFVVVEVGGAALGGTSNGCNPEQNREPNLSGRTLKRLATLTKRKAGPMYMTAAPTLRVLSASTLVGDKVVSEDNEPLGSIEELMIDLDRGCIAYAVLSFGGILGLGDKLFAIPWNALRVDAVEKRVILNVKKDKLEKAPGFDKDHWPNMASLEWSTEIYSYYGAKPLWE
jgi:sporulation protein YlmC with PRC-barrel domain